METILGSFEARKANTWSGDILYSMVVSTERLVGVRIGGQFAVEGGGQAGLGPLGLIGGLVKGLVGKGGGKKGVAAGPQPRESSPGRVCHRRPQQFELIHALPCPV